MPLSNRLRETVQLPSVHWAVSKKGPRISPAALGELGARCVKPVTLVQLGTKEESR